MLKGSLLVTTAVPAVATVPIPDCIRVTMVPFVIFGLGSCQRTWKTCARIHTDTHTHSHRHRDVPETPVLNKHSTLWHWRTYSSGFLAYGFCWTFVLFYFYFFYVFWPWSPLTLFFSGPNLLFSDNQLGLKLWQKKVGIVFTLTTNLVGIQTKWIFFSFLCFTLDTLINTRAK